MDKVAKGMSQAGHRAGCCEGAEHGPGLGARMRHFFGRIACSVRQFFARGPHQPREAARR
jgi:hypothetical protein